MRKLSKSSIFFAIILTFTIIVGNRDLLTQRCVTAASLMYGDADNDTAITANDALCVLKSVVGLITPDNALKQVMDVDGDNRITAGDALCILKYVVGLVNHFDAEMAVPTETVSSAPPSNSPEPTAESSMEPPGSPEPSAKPALTEGPVESLEPTAVPTIAPTVAPTTAPTTTPTITPTVTPTTAPTVAPTDAPYVEDLFLCPRCGSYMEFKESLWSPSSKYLYTFSFQCNVCNREIKKERPANACPDCASPGKIIWKSWELAEGQRSFKEEHYHNHYFCGGCGMDFGKDDGAAGDHIAWADFYAPCGNYTLSPAAFYDENTGIWWDYKYSLEFHAYWDDTINGFNYGRRYPDHVHYECTKCGQRW